MTRLSLKEWCDKNNRQDLLDEWDNEKNAGVMPSDMPPMSNKKVWWRCGNGHEWQSKIENRTALHRGCPICGRKKQISSANKNHIAVSGSLMTVNPQIASEWHPIKNGGLTPEDVSKSSNKKVWWKCKKGHEWQASVNNRTGKRSGCPYCAKQRFTERVKNPSSFVHEGQNDLQTKCPEIASEWHPTKNNLLQPEEVAFRSERKVWWLGKCGHEWITSVKDRTTQNGGCPFCAGKRVLLGFNDLVTWCKSNHRMDLLNEWDKEKNGDLLPTSITGFSQVPVWWKCKEGHEWRAKIGNRTALNRNCPYCAGRYVIKGQNDLQTLFPEIAKEWHPTKNGGLSPDDVKPFTNRIVWWKCKNGHEWKASVNSRSRTGCPFCSSAGTSLPEQGVAFYLKKVCKIEQRSKIHGFEIDVFLPEYKVGIEYDGRYYHQEETRHKETRKDSSLKKQGITIVRIKEADDNRVDANTICYKADSMGTNYEWAIKQLCGLLASITKNERLRSINIDHSQDIIRIREQMDLYSKAHSLSTQYPAVAKEWNYEKNGLLKPEMFTPSNNLVKVWWKCKEGHDWQSVISVRTRGGGCPICSGHRIIEGINDFKSWCIANSCEYLLSEWDVDKNTDLQPTNIGRGSNRKAWWKCSQCGYEWQAPIKSRATGHGCPVCGHRRVVCPEDSLTKWCEKHDSQLLTEWNYERNVNTRPEAVSYGSSAKVWWKCELGHEWQASLSHRTTLGQGCPCCFRIRVGRKVRNVDTGEVFDTLEDAAKSCGLKRGTKISYCCQGRPKYNTAGGFHWEFVVE